MPLSRRPPPLGLVLIVALALGWGLNWQAMKVALSEIPLWQFRALTAFAAGAIMLGLAVLMRQRLRVPLAQWRPAADRVVPQRHLLVRVRRDRRAPDVERPRRAHLHSPPRSGSR